MKESKPSYDKNRNPIFVEGKSPINHNKTWRKKAHKEFYEEFGHWYYYSGMKSNSKKGWIERFRKENNKGN
jgi:hypothetical protein